MQTLANNLIQRWIASSLVGFAIVATANSVGCHRIGIRANDDSIAAYDENDDWALPPSNDNVVDSPYLKRKAMLQAKNVGQVSPEPAPVKQETAPKLVQYGAASNSPPGTIANEKPTESPKSMLNVVDTYQHDVDVDAALEALPPNYRDVLKRQLAAVQNSKAAKETAVASSVAPDSNASAEVTNKQKDAPKSSAISLHVSDHDTSNPPVSIASVSNTNASPVVSASGTATPGNASSGPVVKAISDTSPNDTVSNALASVPVNPSNANADIHKGESQPQEPTLGVNSLPPTSGTTD